MLLARAMKWLASILALPIQRWHWAAAEDARRAQRWEDLVGHLEALHRWYFESDGSHYLLGIGYAQLWRDEEAIEEFSKVCSPLERRECEEGRQLTLALCLSRMGKWKIALDALKGFDPQDWTSQSHKDYYRALLDSVSFIEKFERETWRLVQEASREGNWKMVVELLKPLHERDFGTCTTLVLEADAHGCMEEWAESLASLDKIGEVSPYSPQHLRSRYIWLRALALLKLGRIKDYEAVTTSVDETLACPSDIRDELDRSLRANT